MKDKENAMKFIKELKRKTRKRYNSEEKIAVVLAGFKQEESIAQICRNHGSKTFNNLSNSKESRTLSEIFT